MPTISDWTPYIKKVSEEIAALKGVQNVFVWGSYAENIKNSKYNVKDIDLLVVCDFHSGDLLAIDKTPDGPLDIKLDLLEDMGFSPSAVTFTKNYLKYAELNIDQWALSKDKKLLHWGPLTDTVDEWKDLRSSAENNAKMLTGLTRRQLCKASEELRQQWKEAYDRTVQDFMSGDPIGWYCAESAEDDILKRAIKLA